MKTKHFVQPEDADRVAELLRKDAVLLDYSTGPYSSEFIYLNLIDSIVGDNFELEPIDNGGMLIVGVQFGFFILAIKKQYTERDFNNKFGSSIEFRARSLASFINKVMKYYLSEQC